MVNAAPRCHHRTLAVTSTTIAAPPASHRRVERRPVEVAAFGRPDGGAAFRRCGGAKTFKI
jgi:hypothetical protein